MRLPLPEDWLYPSEYMQSKPSEDLLARIQDASLRAALHRVDVPSSLPERIKRAVELERKSTASVDFVTSTGPIAANCQLATEPIPSTLFSRRRILVAASAASLAGIAGAGAYAYFSYLPLEPEWLARECVESLQRIESEPAAWRALAPEELAERELVKSHLQPVRWTGVHQLSVKPPVVASRAFRLDAGDGRDVILLRIELSRKISGLSSRLEALQGTSGKWAIAAMCEYNQVTALAVAGNNADLQRYIRVSRAA